MAQQDIRNMIIQNKKKALQKREENKREQQLESDMVKTAEIIELAVRREEERSSRLQRGRDQREALLEDIKKKTEEAKLRMIRRMEQELVLTIERERRLERAGRQQMETLEKLHKMDWQDKEQNDEGKGRTKDMKHTLTLVCATTQEKKRKETEMDNICEVESS